MYHVGESGSAEQGIGSGKFDINKDQCLAYSPSKVDNSPSHTEKANKDYMSSYSYIQT